MATRSYRRKLRVSIVDKIVPNGIINNKNCELYQIQETFYRILDMITRQDQLNDTLLLLQSITSKMETRVEHYKVLDMIEENLLSVVMNIEDSINPDIIRMRIEYIKTYIEQLGVDCNDLGRASILIMELLDSIISTVSFTGIETTISNIQSYISTKYGTIEEMNKIQTIQDNLLGIICNIEESISPGIVSYRVEYVKELIGQL